MFGYNKVLHIVTICICITFGIGTQVDVYYNDVSNPTKLALEEWPQRKPRRAEQAGYDLALGCERPSMYICEEPENVVPIDNTKTCNYRSVRYHEQVYKWVAGRGCLFYTPDFLYIGGNNNFNLSVACLYGDLFAPCLEMAKQDGTCGCFPFDPALQEVARAVRKAVIPAAYGRWERCFYAASDCCSHHMSGAVQSSSRCDSTFDGWTCWDEADADTVASKVCSEFAYSNSGPTCHHYSTKQCHQNGTWELQTDYSSCSISPRLVRRYRFHIAVLSFSIAACLPAVFIFFSYKRLRVTRVALHRNLLIVIIVRNVLVIVSRSLVYIDELTNSGDTVMSSHGYPCRILAVAERFAANCVFVAMLVEGIYLHRTIVAVFKKKLKVAWLYGLGAVIAIIPALVWAIIMGLLNNHSCWVVYTVEHIQWILDGPRITILLVNTALFIDVLRVLLTKIRNSENANQLSTTKATLFLMPLFGTQFLLTAFRPTTTDCTGEQIYFYVSYTVEGLQGFIVALLYCYVNKEVHLLMKATYKKTENAVVSAIRRDSSYHRPSNGKSDRRLTCTTGLPSHHDEKEHSSEDISPKLHVAEIISIRATEKLAEILEPIYETVQNGIVNESLNSERVHAYTSSNKYPKDEYYAFTNASSISIDCHDWIKCVSSPSSSLYNNSLNEYETRYLEKKFPNNPKLEEFIKARDRNFENERAVNFVESDKPHDYKADTRAITHSDNIATAGSDCGIIKEEESMPRVDSGLDDGIEDIAILEEIMQYIDKCDKKPVTLDPKLLCPNRKEEYKVVFVDD